MSDTVHYTGKIKKLDFGDLTEDEIKIILKQRDFTIPAGYELGEVEGLLIINGQYYEEIEKEKLCEGDVFHAEKHGDEIHFRVQYYNGGCCFEEALEEALNNSNIK